MTRAFNWSSNVSYQPEHKARFHSMGRARLRMLAALLELPVGSFDIRSNKGGIAVSGEVTLHAERVYVQVSQSCLGGGMGVLVRSCEGRHDYMGGRNHWLPLSQLNDLEALALRVRAVMGEG